MSLCKCASLSVASPDPTPAPTGPDAGITIAIVIQWPANEGEAMSKKPTVMEYEMMVEWKAVVECEPAPTPWACAVPNVGARAAPVTHCGVAESAMHGTCRYR